MTKMYSPEINSKPHPTLVQRNFCSQLNMRMEKFFFID